MKPIINNGKVSKMTIEVEILHSSDWSPMILERNVMMKMRKHVWERAGFGGYVIKNVDAKKIV